jgi:hypothetical protein
MKLKLAKILIVHGKKQIIEFITFYVLSGLLLVWTSQPATQAYKRLVKLNRKNSLGSKLKNYGSGSN